MIRSLELAGAPEMDYELEERVFQRIYSIFGSQLAYERFEDALPFIHWAGRHGVTCGLLSNADDRYGAFNISCSSVSYMSTLLCLGIFFCLICR